MNKNQKITALVLSVALAIVAVYIFAGPKDNSDYASVVRGVSAQVHYDPSCGCCAQYIPYLRRQGFDTEATKMPASEIQDLKVEHDISRADTSCHTTIVDGYVVEGHIPFEAIEKLLEERPDIQGIAMGGMPSGSPGMPGRKTETFTINQINKDGTTSVFMEL